MIGGGFSSLEEIKEARPDFLKEEFIRDKCQKRPGDKLYDETTLWIPSEVWKTFTPAMKQYWEIKQDNYEKILFFKLGKFYEIFYNDAIICQRILDLNWMGGAKKLHVGFPEKALDKYLSILVKHGYKVAVVEQTETPKMMEKRIKNTKGHADKCVERKVTEIVTKGTFTDRRDEESSGYEPKYILTYRKFQKTIGVTFFDVTTLKIFIG